MRVSFRKDAYFDYSGIRCKDVFRKEVVMITRCFGID